MLKLGIVTYEIAQDWDNEYPWKKLFSLLKDSGYNDFCLAEMPGSPEPERLLRYYRALFKAHSE